MTQNIHKIYLIVVIGIVFVPLSSIQHFIWPLSWCLLADFCNHTWIPECGFDELEDNKRIFLDECDMFEYNCDHEKDFETTNYSNCFKIGAMTCPTSMPCPSKPACPDHRFHRAGDRYVFVTPQRRTFASARVVTPATLKVKVKRRFYTPQDAMRYRRRSYRTRRISTNHRRTRPKGYPTRHTWPTRTVLMTTAIHNETRFQERAFRFHTNKTKFTLLPVVLKAETVVRFGRKTRHTWPTRTVLRTTAIHNETRFQKRAFRFQTNKTKFKLQPVVLKAETVFRFGRKVMRVVKDYEVTNYSDCFVMGKAQCPSEKPCPSNPPCPNHKYHRMGDKYIFVTPRRQGRRMMTLDHTLPVNMMKGKRRYTPERKKRQQRAKRKKYLATKTKFTKPTKVAKKTNSKSVTETIILKRETIQVNGKKLVKVVKGLAWKPGKPLKIIEEIEGKGKVEDDFLE